ncbi:hypothetical protein [Lysobacter sp. F6437]|uniref:hypothetical protein n=1 Tax=Lysobacter sp. F6437 TaxID=3459296 RepID=UPI00403DBBCC
MKCLIALLLVIFAVSQLADATAQMPDKLLLDGEEVPLHTNPLQSYLYAHRDEVPKFRPMTTANWRGYVATFAIRDGYLIVDKVEVRMQEDGAKRGMDAERKEYRLEPPMEDIVTQVFNGRDDVPATWYTGALVIPRGEVIDYVHMGYGSTSERYTLLRVREGRVIERLDMGADDFTAYRRKRFDAFKATPAYAVMLADVTSGEYPMEPADAEEFLYQYKAEYYLSRGLD